MFAKRIFFIISLVVLFLPQASFAQIDQRCWREKECQEARAGMGLAPGKANDGFYTGSDTIAACGKEDAAGNKLGFCLPGGSTVTNISFGGKREFLHMGEFISDMFQYSIIVAGILSVIMIIIAGFQWTMSGGSPDRIGSAKKRIGGAVIGLTIAVLSYTILNTINPNLVNLRLPQTWMVNTQGIAPPYCSVIQGKLLAEYAKQGTEMNQTTKDEKIKNAKYTIKPESALCGNDYLVDGTGGQMCAGTACANPNQICFRTVNEKVSSCKTGKIAGTIRNSGFLDNMAVKGDNIFSSAGLDLLGEFWAWPWIPKIQLYGVCSSDGELDVVKNTTHTPSKNDTTHRQSYILNFSEADLDAAINSCGSAGFKGFLLGAELNIPNNPVAEEMHLIGNNDGQHVDICDMFYGVVTQYLEGDCERTLSNNSPGVPQQYFFTKEQLLKGMVFDIDVANIPLISNIDERRLQHYSKYGWTP